MDGLAFEWSVDSATGRDHDAIDRHHAPPARIVSFSESSYETTAAIRRLEAQRQRGDRILVEGVSTGVAVVSVHSREEAYQSIQPYSIQLTVMALLTLEPSADIRIPIGSRVHYTLKLIRYRKAEIIPMPSAQYKIQVEMIEPESGVDVARFHEKTSILEALALGTVRLSVEDKSKWLARSAPSPHGTSFIFQSWIWLFLPIACPPHTFTSSSPLRLYSRFRLAYGFSRWDVHTISTWNWLMHKAGHYL